MQTPYLLFKDLGLNPDTDVQLEHREKISYRTEHFEFLFFPPETPSEQEKLRRRVHTNGRELFYEDGFMIRYPEPYQDRVAEKLELFNMPSNELDGFFSRIHADGSTVTINGSGLYLQMLFSFRQAGVIVFSNNFQLLLTFLEKNNLALTVNEDFFASHLFNYSLAYYTFSGTPYNEIEFHDSMENIVIDEDVNSHLENKFKSEKFASISRQERIDLLHRKLRHCLAEYERYIDVSTIGHNLTGGRDSRASFALFMEQFQDKLEIVTGGFNYTHDKVISNFIAKKYGISQQSTEEGTNRFSYDYKKVMTKPYAEEWFIPLFRKVAIKQKFDHHSFEASGFLGNVVTFSGTHKNQIITDNRFKLKQDVLDRLEAKYYAKVERLRAVYGDDAYAMFNVMYNTTNKVASFCRRLKKNTFCMFEFDFFQACYLLESAPEKKNGSLHYELMRVVNPELLTSVPFEANKSFEGMSDTFELQGFKEAGSPRPYKAFLEANIVNILKHLRRHKNSIEFLSEEFFNVIESYVGKEVPPLVVNKVYAALGTLEFKGIEFNDYAGEISIDNGNRYTMEFFEQLYLEHQMYASGLPAMVYSGKVMFKSYVKPDPDVQFRVVVKNMKNNERVEVSLMPETDGYLASVVIPESGKFTVFFSENNRLKKEVKQLYKVSFVAKLQADVLSQTCEQAA